MTRGVFEKFGREGGAILYMAALFFTLLISQVAVAQEGTAPDWANKAGAVGIGSNTTLGGTNGLNFRTYVSPLFGLQSTIGFNISQDSNTWCRHQPGSGSPVVFGPTGPIAYAPDGGPSSVLDQPRSNETVQNPQYWSSFTSPTIPVTSDCTGSSCPGSELFTSICTGSECPQEFTSILDQLETCDGGSCTSTTQDQPETPCDCSAQEAAVRQAQADLTAAQTKATAAQTAFDQAVAESQAAAERENTLRAEENALPHGSAEKAAKTAERKAARNERKAKVKAAEAARTARDAADTAVDAAKTALDAAQKALDDCRKNCPGGSSDVTFSDQPLSITSDPTASGLTTGQPSTTSSPPSSTPSQPTTPVISATTGAKIKIAVLTGSVGSQQAVAGQSVKITGFDFGLPPDCTSGCDESNKTDVAADQGPTQCTTGSDGSCSLDLALANQAELGVLDNDDDMDSGSSEDVDWYKFTVDTPAVLYLDSMPQASQIAVVQGSPSDCPLSGRLCDSVIDQFQVGSSTRYVLSYAANLEESIIGQLGQDSNIQFFETNYCDEKKLPAPPQYSKPLAARGRTVNSADQVGHAKIRLIFGELEAGD